MRTFVLSFCLVAMAMLLCSCEFFSYGNITAYNNRKKIAKIRTGMTKAEVLEVMGEPLKDELYNKPDFWFYYTELRWADGLETRDECSPVVFEDGVVIGWGNDYYEKNFEFKDWDEEVYNKNEREAMERAYNRLSKELEEKYNGKNRSKLSLEDMRALRDNAKKLLDDKSAKRVEKTVEKTLKEPEAKKAEKKLENDVKDTLKDPDGNNVKKLEKDLKDESKTKPAKKLKSEINKGLKSELGKDLKKEADKAGNKLKKEIKEEDAGNVESVKEIDEKFGKKLNKDSTKNLKKELNQQLDAEKEGKELKNVQNELNQELKREVDGENPPSKEINEVIKKADDKTSGDVK